MTVPVLSRRELEFLLYEWLDVTALAGRARYREHSRETFDGFLQLSADIAIDQFAPHSKLADAREPVMRPDGTVEMIPGPASALASSRRRSATPALNQIHEGTHGIQGLDLLGRKVAMEDGAGLRNLADAIRSSAARAEAAGGELPAHGVALRSAADRLVGVTGVLWSAGDPALTLANSSVYLEATGHVAVAWMWLEQLLAADGKEGGFYNGKRQAGRYFFRHQLPKTAAQFGLLAALDRTTLDAQPD